MQKTLRSETQRKNGSPRPNLIRETIGPVQPLRAVIEAHREDCFLDTDGVTRDAARMLQIMDGWLPNQSDYLAGVTRNRCFDPALSVTVSASNRVSYATAEHPGEPSLLFTIVPRDVSRVTVRVGDNQPDQAGE